MTRLLFLDPLECAFGGTVYLTTMSLSPVEETPAAGELYTMTIRRLCEMSNWEYIFGWSHCEKMNEYYNYSTRKL